jgi:hypothetical protein
VSFGLVLTQLGTPLLVERSARLWMLLGLAWVVALLMGVGAKRCFEGIYSPLDTSWPWYRLGGAVTLLTGLIGGSCTAVALSWSSSQVGQISYARARPEVSMIEDMDRVGAMIDSECEARHGTPETMNELVALILEHEVPLHYTWIEDESWVDPWGHSFYYGRDSGSLGLHCGVVIYSFGPNGEDEFREGDDIVMTSQGLDVTDL